MAVGECLYGVLSSMICSRSSCSPAGNSTLGVDGAGGSASGCSEASTFQILVGILVCQVVVVMVVASWVEFCW